MNLLTRVTSSNFFIRLKSWEYWPFGVLQAPLVFYWVWLSLKARSPVFFSASNPGILMGGMFGESKFEVLEKVPASVKPVTLFVKQPSGIDEIMQRMEIAGLHFPVIAKPDLGERGWMVKRINSQRQLDDYLSAIKLDFLIQDLVDLPLEFGVFYVRYPDEPAGRVTSIVGKEMLSITGDGRKTWRELILEKERARLQWEVLQNVYKDKLDDKPGAGETIELISIGNHCLGTKFLNRNDLITPELSSSFDRISKQVDGFYFGRFDLRTASYEDLAMGRVKVLELNGCGAEPAHIYQPGFSFLKALAVMFKHWSDMYRISVENHKHGVAYISFREARSIFRKFRSLTAA
ncbi:MAG TPA: hypothetical protein VG737_05415 [Cyclobacteriaceae bacterium]|nr:hypothetical protein [Cyclobacteriaceae bacterium]